MSILGALFVAAVLIVLVVLIDLFLVDRALAKMEKEITEEEHKELLEALKRLEDSHL